MCMRVMHLLKLIKTLIKAEALTLSVDYSPVFGCSFVACIIIFVLKSKGFSGTQV